MTADLCQVWTLELFSVFKSFKEDIDLKTKMSIKKDYLHTFTFPDSRIAQINSCHKPSFGCICIQKYNLKKQFEQNIISMCQLHKPS